MVAQRGKGVEARAAAVAPRAEKAEKAPRAEKAEKAPRADTPEKAPRKAKLSFREQHALTTLPARMEELRGKIGKLRALLDDPGLYARDPAKFSKGSTLLAETEAALAQSEEDWLELEIKREEAEG
jgi:ABC transport system ATP-binding/permease protein